MPKQVIALPSVKVRLDFSLTKCSRRCQGLWLTFQRPPLRELPKTAPRARIVTLHRWRRLDFSSSPSAMIWVIPRTVLTVLTAPGFGPCRYRKFRPLGLRPRIGRSTFYAGLSVVRVFETEGGVI